MRSGITVFEGLQSGSPHKADRCYYPFSLTVLITQGGPDFGNEWLISLAVGQIRVGQHERRDACSQKGVRRRSGPAPEPEGRKAFETQVSQGDGQRSQQLTYCIVVERIAPFETELDQL